MSWRVRVRAEIRRFSRDPYVSQLMIDACLLPRLGWVTGMVADRRGVPMHLLFTDVPKVAEIPGLDAVELSGLLARWAPAVGTPIVLSEAMTPVEPLCSWFRELGWTGAASRRCGRRHTP